jgi:ATP phosphoribosyltransferase regulatory subunit
LKLGDVAIFHSLVDASNLPHPWGPRIKRAFARPGGASIALAEALAPPSEETSPFGEALAKLDEERAAQAVAEALASARIPVIGGRSVGDIALRLREKAARANGPRPEAPSIERVRTMLAVEGTPDNALSTLTRMTRQPGMKVTSFAEAVDRAAARWEALKALVKIPEQTRFSTALGRGLAYYDGFVFELEAKKLGPRAALGGGGRYDGLLHALARREGARDVSAWGAAGFALRVKRVQDAAP